LRRDASWRQIPGMLHLMKLAVGVRDVPHLRALQAARTPPLRHPTRHRPARAADVLDGGSIYWVIAGAMLARQRVIDIQTVVETNDGKRAALMLDADVVPVAGRVMRPFQGWRYLRPEAAPPDLAAAAAEGAEALPAALSRDLRALALL
jgi:hypothetical protein